MLNSFGLLCTGLLDSITSTADSKDCPGVCVHSLATIICYEVLEDIQCPSPTMKCCVESNNATSAGAQSTTQKPVKITTSVAPVTKPTQKVEKPTKSDTKAEGMIDVIWSNYSIWIRLLFTDGACSGVCVADRIAEYCEAYLITSGLCKVGSKCCVPRDNYPDKLPADLRIPNGNNNQTMAKPTKPIISTTSNSQRPRPPVKMTNRPTRPQEPSRESVEGNQISPRPCDGECVSGLFALFCDELDSEAYCPNEGSCCVGSENSGVQQTTPKPVSLDFIYFGKYKFTIENLIVFPKMFIVQYNVASTGSTKMSRLLLSQHFASILRKSSRYCSSHFKL